MSSLRLVAALLVGALLPAASARAAEWSATLAITSDYVYRGVSLSDGHGALQAGVDVVLAGGLFGGAWLSGVDLRSGLPGGHVRKAELQLFVGYRRRLSRRWSALATLLRYDYPGSEPAGRYSYLEGSVALELRDTATLSVAYTDDAFGQGEGALTTDLTVRWPLGRSLRLVAGLGTYRLEGPFGESYEFWSLGLARGLGPVALEVAWVDTDATAERLFGELAAGRLVVTMVATLP